MVKLPKWAVVLIFLTCWPSAVFAEPWLKASVQGVEIVVHKEDCALKDAVSNLPKRATWFEKGKTFEGCAGAAPHAGVLMFYFLEDKTVAIVPMDAFAKVQAI
jgi:hypothetical protein